MTAVFDNYFLEFPYPIAPCLRSGAAVRARAAEVVAAQVSLPNVFEEPRITCLILNKTIYPYFLLIRKSHFFTFQFY